MHISDPHENTFSWFCIQFSFPHLKMYLCSVTTDSSVRWLKVACEKSVARCTHVQKILVNFFFFFNFFVYFYFSFLVFFFKKKSFLFVIF